MKKRLFAIVLCAIILILGGCTGKNEDQMMIETEPSSETEAKLSSEIETVPSSEVETKQSSEIETTVFKESVSLNKEFKQETVTVKTVQMKIDDEGNRSALFNVNQVGYYMITMDNDNDFFESYAYNPEATTVVETGNMNYPCRDFKLPSGKSVVVFYVNTVGSQKLKFNAEFNDPVPETISIKYIGTISEASVADGQSDIIADVDIILDESANKVVALDLPVEVTFSSGYKLCSKQWVLPGNCMTVGKKTCELAIDSTTFKVDFTVHDYSEYVDRVIIPDEFKFKATRKDMELPESVTVMLKDGTSFEIDPGAYNEHTFPNGKTYAFGGTTERLETSKKYSFDIKMYSLEARYPYNSKNYCSVIAVFDNY